MSCVVNHCLGLSSDNISFVISFDTKREHFSFFQLFSGFVDDQDTNQLLGDLTEDELKKDKDLLNLLKMQIGSWKNELILPERAIGEARDAQKSLFAQLYARYQIN